MNAAGLVAVEDTYGVGFHRRLIAWLAERGLLCSGGRVRVKVRRMPAMKCNEALYRKLVGAALALARGGEWRVLVVIDSEGRPPARAARDDVLRHVKKNRDRFRVVVVEPTHEAWACMSLGGPTGKCRTREGAVEFLERRLGEPYEKRMLERIASLADFNPQRLVGQHDFNQYVDGLRWVYGCA